MGLRQQLHGTSLSFVGATFQNTLGTVTIADSTDTLVALDSIWIPLPSAIIAQYADISAAYLMVYLTSVSGIAGSIAIDCQLSTTAATFVASSNNISGRTLAGQATSWPIGSLSTGWNTSPNFEDAMQSLVNRSGWAGWISAVVVLTGLTGAARHCQMQDGSQSFAAVLVVYFSTASTDESGTLGDTMGSMTASAAFIADDSREGPAIGYHLKPSGLLVPNQPREENAMPLPLSFRFLCKYYHGDSDAPRVGHFAEFIAEGPPKV